MSIYLYSQLQKNLSSDSQIVFRGTPLFREWFRGTFVIQGNFETFFFNGDILTALLQPSSNNWTVTDCTWRSFHCLCNRYNQLCASVQLALPLYHFYARIQCSAVNGWILFLCVRSVVASPIQQPTFWLLSKCWWIEKPCRIQALEIRVFNPLKHK